MAFYGGFGKVGMLTACFEMLGADCRMLDASYFMLGTSFGVLDAKLTIKKANQALLLFFFAHRSVAAIRARLIRLYLTNCGTKSFTEKQRLSMWAAFLNSTWHQDWKSVWVSSSVGIFPSLAIKLLFANSLKSFMRSSGRFLGNAIRKKVSRLIGSLDFFGLAILLTFLFQAFRASASAFAPILDLIAAKPL